MNVFRLITVSVLQLCGVMLFLTSFPMSEPKELIISEILCHSSFSSNGVRTTFEEPEVAEVAVSLAKPCCKLPGAEFSDALSCPPVKIIKWICCTAQMGNFSKKTFSNFREFCKTSEPRKIPLKCAKRQWERVTVWKSPPILIWISILSNQLPVI